VYGSARAWREVWTLHCGASVCQEPPEADDPALPNPPCDAELEEAEPEDADDVPMPPDPLELDDELDPAFPPGQDIDCPVRGSLHREGKTTAVVMTPPPSRTRLIAVERLMK
jgi:hypothetical protein